MPGGSAEASASCRSPRCMHKYGAPCVAQITHRGRRGWSHVSWQRMYGPSAVREPNHRETPHEMDEATIAEFVKAFADASERLKKGGFDGCEVMASHCHLIDQFWTPNANQREDQYGGSIENRIRFAVEIGRQTAAKIGRERLGMRLSPSTRT
mgnify:CR=1 FL=1